MQCRAIALDTTGTAYARQQPSCIEREKERKAKKEKKKEEERKRTPRKIIRMAREDQRGEEKMPRA